MPQPPHLDDVFVIAAFSKKWVAHVMGASHTAVATNGRPPKETYKLMKESADSYGVDLSFSALRRRKDLLAWAEQHGAYLLLEPPKSEEPIDLSYRPSGITWTP